MFDWFSLDVIYYPVSAIMWVWYKAFAFLLGPTNFFAWALSVMFLVFTLRALLYKPFVRQIRTTRQMQELQPQIKALQKKYGKDRQRMAVEMQKLQKEHGFNPVLGCLPMLAQIPVFLGLFHVLRSFNRTQGGFGQIQLSVEQNRATGNYVFSATDVGHFLDANLFGAPLGATMIQTSGIDAFTEFSRAAVIGVGVPVMILAGIATYFNSRASIARQSIEAAANPQTAMMNKLALYVFPLGVVVGGPFLPLAIILYWLANNVWTFGQQHLVFNRIEKEEEAKKLDETGRRKENAPLSGAKPKWAKNYNPTAEFRSARLLEQDGKGSDAASKVLKVWDYLQQTSQRPPRSDGTNELPGGLIAEVAVWLAPRLRTSDYTDQALQVYDVAAKAARDDFDTEPTWLQLGMYLFHRGGAQSTLLATKQWSRLAARATEDMDLLSQWETVEVPGRLDSAGAKYASPDVRRVNRFLWNYRAARANYEVNKFNSARSSADSALAVVDGWTDEYRAQQASVQTFPGGYTATVEFDRAVLLLIGSAAPEKTVKQLVLGRGEKQRRSDNALKAVALLKDELARAQSSDEAGAAAVESVEAFYRAALQQVNNLYARNASSAVTTAVTSAGVSADAGVDLLSQALDDYADMQIVDAVDALAVKGAADDRLGPSAEAAGRSGGGPAAPRADKSTGHTPTGPGSKQRTNGTSAGKTPQPGSRSNKRRNR